MRDLGQELADDLDWYLDKLENTHDIVEMIYLMQELQRTIAFLLCGLMKSLRIEVNNLADQLVSKEMQKLMPTEVNKLCFKCLK